MTNGVLIARHGRFAGILALWLRRFLHALATAMEDSGSGDGTLAAAAERDSALPGPGKRDVAGLYRKYSASLYWVLKCVRNREDAEDRVNQVFVKVRQNLPGVQGRSGI